MYSVNTCHPVCGARVPMLLSFISIRVTFRKRVTLTCYEDFGVSRLNSICHCIYFGFSYFLFMMGVELCQN